ncbi:hypothetical protein uav_049 [Pseudomonas phage UAVern]|uniref:dATP/dGTP diphosphohydrolase N-terminal domain-containing protein n=1 Tax=Pseudomonas phage UAVern TaxID=2856997 RepID=A0A975UY35_9CAUD|nr:hypothetical protein uav_049 [Pseudomonas phage UAVern]
MTPQDLVDLPEGAPVRVTSDYCSFKEGDTIYRRKNLHDDALSCFFSENPNGSGTCHFMTTAEVERIEPLIIKTLAEAMEELTAEDLGTFRPVLETRKVGKVRVELVDDGFPLALREIAKVMTWAQTAKGYKDHDWQNLPDAQVQLAAAASRHRTDQIQQHVVEGKPLLQCVDPESKLVHKAHEAFGVLAQLELMLRERAE